MEANAHGPTHACTQTTGVPMRADIHAQADTDALECTHARTPTHTHTVTHSGMKQTQSVGYTDMSSSLVMSVRGYDCSCLCSSCEFEQCLFRKVGLVPFSLKSVLHEPSTASTPDHDPPPPLARGQVIVPVRPQQGVCPPA